MDKNTLLLSLYLGRSIDYKKFNEYFSSSPSRKNEFSHEVVDETGFVVYELVADVTDDCVRQLHVYKSEDLSGLYGRPYAESKQLTSSEWKHAFQVFDECFPDQSAGELDGILKLALENKVSYSGYTITKIKKTTVDFIGPHNTVLSMQKKHISYAVQYSHIELSILFDPSVTDEFISCFTKKPFETVFAVLSVVRPETYTNYDELNFNYRYKRFLNAIQSLDVDRCKEYEDVIRNPECNIQIIGNIISSTDSPDIIEWFFEIVPDRGCSLNGMLCDAIRNNDSERIDTIIRKGLFNTSSLDSHKPMEAAIEMQANVLTLLKAGFFLYSEEYLASLSLDELKEILQYSVCLFESTIKRIISEKRYDIVQMIEEYNKDTRSKELLLSVYIASNEYERFKQSVEKYMLSGIKLENSILESAYKAGKMWSDFLLEKGFDINQASGELLYEACRDAVNADYVIYLLQNGADPYVKREHSSTIFELVAKNSGFSNDKTIVPKEKVCRCLLDLGVDPIMESTSTPSIITYFMSYSREFKLHLIEWLHEHGRINDYECQNDKTRSPHMILSRALDVWNYDPLVLRKLIEYGARADVYEDTEEALFVQACRVCDVDELKLLIHAGANVNETERGNHINGLYAAISRNRPRNIIEFLINTGLDVNNCYDIYDYKTEISLEDNGEYSVTTKKHLKQSTSVLDVAQEKCDIKIVELLKENGAESSTILKQKENRDALNKE